MCCSPNAWIIVNACPHNLSKTITMRTVIHVMITMNSPIMAVQHMEVFTQPVSTFMDMLEWLL